MLRSVFSVVFIHFSHCGELWFTLIQPVVWALLKGNVVKSSAWEELGGNSPTFKIPRGLKKGVKLCST